MIERLKLESTDEKEQLAGIQERSILYGRVRVFRVLPGAELTSRGLSATA